MNKSDAQFKKLVEFEAKHPATLRGWLKTNGDLPVQCETCKKLIQPGAFAWLGYGGWAACNNKCAMLFLRIPVSTPKHSPKLTLNELRALQSCVNWVVNDPGAEGIGKDMERAASIAQRALDKMTRPQRRP
jgi:hypothetical protein